MSRNFYKDVSVPFLAITFVIALDRFHVVMFLSRWRSWGLGGLRAVHQLIELWPSYKATRILWIKIIIFNKKLSLARSVIIIICRLYALLLKDKVPIQFDLCFVYYKIVINLYVIILFISSTHRLSFKYFNFISFF